MRPARWTHRRAAPRMRRIRPAGTPRCRVPRSAASRPPVFGRGIAGRPGYCDGRRRQDRVARRRRLCERSILWRGHAGADGRIRGRARPAHVEGRRKSPHAAALRRIACAGKPDDGFRSSGFRRGMLERTRRHFSATRGIDPLPDAGATTRRPGRDSGRGDRGNRLGRAARRLAGLPARSARAEVRGDRILRDLAEPRTVGVEHRHP